MSTGLKSELGLGEPKPPGSTEQADRFKAAFQAELAKVNEGLQYTAAHAEKSKHDPAAAKRDKTCSAYQIALGRIDPANAAAAQGAIDQVLAGVQAVRSALESLKADVECAYNAWTQREGELDGVTENIREMVEWGHDKAAALQKIVDAIAAKANERKYDEALTGLTGLIDKLGPLYEEHQRQKAAQEEYDTALAALEQKLGETKTCEFATLEPKQKEIADSEAQMRQAADAKDYVTALARLRALEQLVDAYMQEAEHLRATRQEYERARAALDPRLTQASASQYASLAELDQSIAVELTARTDGAAAADDYELATQFVGELTTAVDEKLQRDARGCGRMTKHTLALRRKRLSPHPI